MNFLKLFLRGIGLLPGIIQGIEAVYGAKSGAQKRDAALDLVTSAINLTDAVANKNVVDANGFAAGLGQIVDGVVACLNSSLWAKPAAQ